jgi:HSP20 family protein
MEEVGCMSDLRWRRRWDPLQELQREMDRLFGSLDPMHSARQIHQYPPVNLYDAADRYVLSVQMPGIAPSDIELTITGETLTLGGERTRPEGVKEDCYRRQERPMGRWSRTITLPDRIESTRVGASFADGILTVTFPKAESAQPRQITVTAAAQPT